MMLLLLALLMLKCVRQRLFDARFGLRLDYFDYLIVGIRTHTL
jgi:hypothetical protein